ncbi:hypothetical protein GGX14DRAFT_569687 [Mycena pura]|uniref:Uncharacterized protein n=1 Tax=Mycena pura TaxID=153505 RepID=A0AAD6Y7T1_9AGAR|nr:hypothetical protein GGX14DRAFT_569687 [Mycena pura]
MHRHARLQWRVGWCRGQVRTAQMTSCAACTSGAACVPCVPPVPVPAACPPAAAVLPMRAQVRLSPSPSHHVCPVPVPSPAARPLHFTTFCIQPGSSRTLLLHAPNGAAPAPYPLPAKKV